MLARKQPKEKDDADRMLDRNDLTESFSYSEPIRDWGLARNQFAILFGERVPLC